MAEVFRSVTDGIWCDLPAKGAAPKPVSSVIRRNLQREQLKRLTALVVGEKSNDSMFFFGSTSAAAPPDARSLAHALARIHKKIEQTLGAKPAGLDDTHRAHLEECHERIGKVLAASVQVNEP